jgi:hypothetical protein
MTRTATEQLLAALRRRTEPISGRECQLMNLKPAHELNNSPVSSALPPGYPAGRASLCYFFDCHPQAEDRNWPVLSPRRPVWIPDQQRDVTPVLRKPTARGMFGWNCSPRSSSLRCGRRARPMPDTRQPQPTDSGDAQLSLFGPGEPESALPPTGDPSGPCEPGPTVPGAEIPVPVRLAPEFSAAQSPALPPLLLPSNQVSALPGQTGESTGVATPDAGQLEKSANACILSSSLNCNIQDALLPAQPLRFTIDSLYYLVEAIARIRDRKGQGRGGAHVQTEVSDPSEHGTKPEPGEAPGQPPNGC